MNNDDKTSPHYLHRTDKWPPAEKVSYSHWMPKPEILD